MEHTTDTAVVALAILALSVPETEDELAERLSDELIIADDLGRRAVPASVARELIAAEARRRYDVAEAQRRRQAAPRERFRVLSKKHPVPAGVALVVPPGTSAVEVMTAAAGPPEYEGGTYRPVPSNVDWLFGEGDTGGTIGPTREQMQRDALARKKKRGGAR
jgi:hypothetical protein